MNVYMGTRRNRWESRQRFLKASNTEKLQMYKRSRNYVSYYKLCWRMGWLTESELKKLVGAELKRMRETGHREVKMPTRPMTRMNTSFADLARSLKK